MLHSVSFRNIYYGTLWQMEKDVYHSIVCNSKRPKQPKCPLGGDWLNELQYIRTVKYIKK